MYYTLRVGLGDASQCAFLTSDWMCISCHKVCNHVYSMSSFVLCEVSFWWECLFTCFTTFFNFHCVSATIELVFLQTILLCVHIFTLFTLKLASTSFATPMSQTLHCVDISNVLLQNISCVELSFTDVTVGLVFLVVFSVVLAETTWTAEFFSTIGTLVLNVHGSKSGSIRQYSKEWVLSIFDRLC